MSGHVRVTNRFAQGLRSRNQFPSHPVVVIRPLHAPGCLKKTGIIPFPGLAQDDPMCPLKWGRSFSVGKSLDMSYRGHPKIKYLNKYKQLKSVLWPDESGTLFTQDTIEQRIPAMSSQNQETYIHFLNRLKVFSSKQGGVWAVCARNRTNLEWFQRDMTRLFGARVFFQEGNLPPVYGSYLGQFALLTDAWLNWHCPHPVFLKKMTGLVELDTWPGSLKFRSYRFRDLNVDESGGWITHRNPEGWACLQMEQQRLHFQFDHGMWRSCDVPGMTGRNMTAEFYHRYCAIRLISRVNRAEK
jgi:hypothetical protein